ncbi:hypothetical protein V8C86DRAFT_2645652 [Haematococcus lacustris]
MVPLRHASGCEKPRSRCRHSRSRGRLGRWGVKEMQASKTMQLRGAALNAPNCRARPCGLALAVKSSIACLHLAPHRSTQKSAYPEVLVQARVWDDYEESWVYVDDELQEACAAIRRMCALLRSIYHDQDRVPLELLEEELQQLVESTGISRSMLKKAFSATPVCLSTLEVFPSQGYLIQVLRNSRHKRVSRSEIKQYPLTKRAMVKYMPRQEE